MIVKIEGYEKQSPNRCLWQYAFATDLLFSDFVLNGCLLEVKNPLPDHEPYFGSYDVDVENWNLNVNIINFDYIKRKSSKYDLEIRFLPNNLVKVLGFREIPYLTN